MEDHPVFGMLLLQLDQVFQPADIRHAVSALCGKGMRKNLVVPEIHVQRQFVVCAFHIESRHIAYDALHRPVNLHFGQQKIRENPGGFPGLLVPVVLGIALDSRRFAAFVGIRIGKDKSCIKPDLGIQPAVSVGRIFQVIFLKQQNTVQKVFLLVRRMGKAFLPGVEAAAQNPHHFAEDFDRKRSGQFHDHLVFLLSYRITVPSPFTS